MRLKLRMHYVQSFVAILLSLGFVIAADAGSLIIPDGDTYLVLNGEQLTTGDVQVQGTFRDQGEVTHTGLFENFGFTDNQGLFTNLGEFRNDGQFESRGTFINEGSVINGKFSLFESFGSFSSSGYMENHWLGFFSELNVSGVLVNFGELSTLNDSMHLLTGDLTNAGS